MRLKDILALNNGELPKLAGAALTTEFLEEREVNSEFGEIYYEGHYQGDLIGFNGTIARERREVPVAGRDNIVYREGRVSRTGTVSVAKVGSEFEALAIQIAGTNVEERRQLRNEGIDPAYKTYLTIKLDDPDAWGSEELVLFGVRFWEFPVGYAGAAIIQRDYPITWQSESLTKAIPRPVIGKAVERLAAKGTKIVPDGANTFPNYGTITLP
jgi:hypothetical protein